MQPYIWLFQHLTICNRSVTYTGTHRLAEAVKSALP